MLCRLLGFVVALSVLELSLWAVPGCPCRDENGEPVIEEPTTRPATQPTTQPTTQAHEQTTVRPTDPRHPA